MAPRAKDDLGRAGEDMAAHYLADRGMLILRRNWRCEIGELDIIALDRRELVICEVKTRRSVAQGHPIEAVSQEKFERMQRLAMRWLTEHRISPRPQLRYDIVGIVMPQSGPATIDHVKGVTI